MDEDWALNNTHFSILSSVCSINTIYRIGNVMRLQNTMKYENQRFEKHYNEGLLIQNEYSYKTFFYNNERNTNILEMT